MFYRTVRSFSIVERDPNEVPHLAVLGAGDEQRRLAWERRRRRDHIRVPLRGRHRGPYSEQLQHPGGMVWLPNLPNLPNLPAVRLCGNLAA